MNRVGYASHVLFDLLFTSLMFKTSALTVMLAVLMAHFSLEAASPVFKCASNGKITYQSTPCPSGERRDAPTVDQLNAERQNRLRQVGITPPTSQASSGGGELSSTSSDASRSSSLSVKERPPAAVTPLASPINSFKCDGRTHCSQMTSCLEAKYFLKHCPSVKMDGDGDGIPCEQQLCSK